MQSLIIFTIVHNFAHRRVLMHLYCKFSFINMEIGSSRGIDIMHVRNSQFILMKMGQSLTCVCLRALAFAYVYVSTQMSTQMAILPVRGDGV